MLAYLSRAVSEFLSGNCPAWYAAYAAGKYCSTRYHTASSANASFLADSFRRFEAVRAGANNEARGRQKMLEGQDKLPAAAWYLFFYVRFSALRAETAHKRIKYRSAQA